MSEEQVYIRPGVSVAESLLDYFTRKAYSRTYAAMLALCLAAAVVVVASMLRNAALLAFEEKYGHPGVALMVSLMCVFFFTLSFLAHESLAYSQALLYPLLLLLLFWGLWAVSLFFSRFDRGSPLLFGTVLLLISVYYAVVCARASRTLAAPAAMACLWAAYCVYYTYAISRHPWTPNPPPTPPPPLDPEV